jgi:hypothetical protein
VRHGRDDGGQAAEDDSGPDGGGPGVQPPEHDGQARKGEEFGAPPPGDPGGGVVELDEQLFELVGVVALVTAAAAVLGHGVTAFPQGWYRRGESGHR